MHARALPSVPGHVPIWANFVVYGPILKISNSMCISNGNLEFSPPNDPLLGQTLTKILLQASRSTSRDVFQSYIAKAKRYKYFL